MNRGAGRVAFTFHVSRFTPYAFTPSLLSFSRSCLMVALKNDTFLRAALRDRALHAGVDHASGRPLPPEYNATRARAGSFLALAKSPDFATEVTLQPLGVFRSMLRSLFRHPHDPGRHGPRALLRGRRTGPSGRCATNARSAH